MELPLSIIIPTRNEEKYLPRLLESIKNQTAQPAEVIVADNHSDDRTAEIARSYGAKVIQGADHPGIGRNNGARVATQPYLLFFDADVYFANDFLEKNFAEFQERKLGAASCYLFEDTNAPLDKVNIFFTNLFFGSIQTILAYGHGICIFARADVHKRLGGFDESLVLAEDWDYTNRANKITKYRFLKSRKILLSYRRYENEGRTKLFLKYSKVFFHVLFIGKIKNYIVPYKFANYSTSPSSEKHQHPAHEENTPLISVVIPAYNEEKLIAKCVHAVTHQTFPRDKYEVLVINNNSTDRTAEIAKEAGATVLLYTERQGFSVAKQFGTKMAKAPIIAYTDADSIPNSHWLETIYELMKDPKLVCVGGTILSLGNNKLAKNSLSFYDRLAQLNQKLKVSLIWSPNMAVRKEAFMGIGGFNLDLKTSDDWDFVMRIQKKYGRDSTLYTNKLQVKTSPRKQEKLSLIVPYTLIGIANYVTIFGLRKSKAYGSHSAVR